MVSRQTLKSELDFQGGWRPHPHNLNQTFYYALGKALQLVVGDGEKARRRLVRRLTMLLSRLGWNVDELRLGPWRATGGFWVALPSVVMSCQIRVGG